MSTNLSVSKPIKSGQVIGASIREHKLEPYNPKESSRLLAIGVAKRDMSEGESVEFDHAKDTDDIAIKGDF